jgi:hypothetical protein
MLESSFGTPQRREDRLALNQPFDQQIVLGMGAGQCGLNLFREILAKQPSSQVTLEQSPLLPWQRRTDLAAINERIARWKSTCKERLVGDVATFYLPYVEQAIECEPGIRIVCLKRCRDVVIAAYSQFLNESTLLPINHWTETPGPSGHHDPLWTQTFPQYDTEDRAEGIGRYWSEYYERADDLARQYADNFIIVDADTLTNADGVRRILDFIGIDRELQVVATGNQPPLTAPPVEELSLPTPRYDDRFDPRRCAILVPFVGSIQRECDAALQELERRGYRVLRVDGYAAIDQARNQLATDALIQGFEETLWIDSDIGFHPDDVEKLRRHELPIVCGIYAQKGKRVFACELAAGTQHVTFGSEGGLLEIQYAGTGFLLIRREVYSTIQRQLQLPICNDRFGRPMIPFFQPIAQSSDDGYWYLAEDYSFCERARQSGFNVFADTSIRLMHIGTYSYGWEDVGFERPRLDSFTLNAEQEDSD